MGIEDAMALHNIGEEEGSREEVEGEEETEHAVRGVINLSRAI